MAVPLPLAVRVYVVVADGETVVEAPDTEPTSGVILTDVASDTDQASVVDWPASMVAGEAENEAMVGAAADADDTLTVVLAVVVPVAFCALSVYVVVAVGLIVIESPVTAPMSGAMEIAVALLTDHDSVTLCPAATVDGAAAKLEMLGLGERPLRLTLTVALALAVGSARLVAVTW